MQLVSVESFFDKTINIFSRKVVLNEYANIGNPLIQNIFPLILFNAVFHIYLIRIYEMSYGGIMSDTQ